MTENAWWSSHVKPCWHRPAEGRIAWKIVDAYNGGFPDVDCMFNGVGAKVELKYRGEWPARDDTIITFSTMDKHTRERSIVSALQWNYLQQYRSAGGNAFVLIGVGKEWYLFEQGQYIQRGMTKGEIQSLCATCDFSGKTYSTLAEIPLYIEDAYHDRRLGTAP